MLAKEKAFIERFKARASHAAQVQSRVKKLEKIDTVQPPKRRQAIGGKFRLVLCSRRRPRRVRLSLLRETPQGGRHALQIEWWRQLKARAT